MLGNPSWPLMILDISLSRFTTLYWHSQGLRSRRRRHNALKKRDYDSVFAKSRPSMREAAEKPMASRPSVAKMSYPIFAPLVSTDRRCVKTCAPLIWQQREGEIR